MRRTAGAFKPTAQTAACRDAKHNCYLLLFPPADATADTSTTAAAAAAITCGLPL